MNKNIAPNSFHRSKIIPILFSLTMASAHITDYSQAKYIPIIDGRILVWEEFAFVRHSANLSEYRRVVEETENMSDMFPQSHMKKLLNVDARLVRRAPQGSQEFRLFRINVKSRSRNSGRRGFRKN